MLQRLLLALGEMGLVLASRRSAGLRCCMLYVGVVVSVAAVFLLSCVILPRMLARQLGERPPMWHAPPGENPWKTLD